MATPKTQQTTGNVTGAATRRSAPCGGSALVWEYSRNQRRHWAHVGTHHFYGVGYWYYYEIHEVRRDSWIHRPGEGYNLYRKGKKLAHAKTVKQLKIIAQNADISHDGSA